MKLKVLFGALLLITFLLGCGRKREVSGQVFVSSEAGTIYRFAAVRVCVYRADVVRSLVQPYVTNAMEIKRQEAAARDKPFHIAMAAMEKALSVPPGDAADDATARMNQAMGEVKRISVMYGRRVDEARQEMLAMGSPLVSTYTDADGNFHLTVTGNDECYLTVQVRRTPIEDADLFYWIVKVGNEAEQRIHLSDMNGIRRADSSTDKEDGYWVREEFRLRDEFKL